jgi:hypothetical protein
MIVPTLTPSDVTRFWSFVARGGDDDCWLWQGGTFGRGYGAFKVAGKQMRAHRISYFIAHGELPQLNICHTCDTPGCMNPGHLFPGTDAENMADRDRKGRQARGDKNGARLHPETRARGAAHGARLHPERLARGDAHWTRLHPERLARGDAHGARLHPETRPRKKKSTV